jgi:hypothetical protein
VCTDVKKGEEHEKEYIERKRKKENAKEKEREKWRERNSQE